MTQPTIIPPPPLRFGRNRPVSLGPHFKLAHYLRSSLAPPPDSVDYSPLALAILHDMMGNDTLGDCVFAAIYHYVGVITALAGAPFHATLEQVVALYSQLTAYVPGDPSTDQGADEVSVLNAICSTVALATGNKAVGWVLVDASNIVEMKQAIFLFEGALMTLECPDTYVNPFPSSDGFSWGVGAPNPNQGHAIMAAGYDSAGPKVVTWGMLGTQTWPAVTALCTTNAGGGFYVLLTPDMVVKASQKAGNGLAWQDLVSDLDAWGASVPLPPPVVVPPGPPVVGGVTLAQVQAWIAAGIASGHPLQTQATASFLATSSVALHWPSS